MTITHSILPVSFGPFHKEPVGKTHNRARRAVSIVVIMRESEMLPSSGPGVVLHTTDLLVAAGPHEGPDTASEILRYG